MTFSISSRTALTLLVLAMPMIYSALISFDGVLNAPVALLLIFCAVAFCYQCIRSGTIHRWHLQTLLAALLLSTVYVTSSLYSHNLNVDSMKTVIQVFVVVGFLFYAQRRVSVYEPSFARLLPLLTLALYVPVLVALTYYARVMGHDDPASFWTRTKNSFGAVLLTLVVLNIVINRQRRHEGRRGMLTGLASGSALVCLLATGSRGSQVALVVTWGAYLLWPFVRPRVFMLVVLLAFIPVFIYAYIHLDALTDASTIESHVQNVTGENLYSGRQLIWPAILDAVSTHSPWLGLGGGAQASTAMAMQGIDSNWSSHDLYLQIYLQGGILGCFALVVLIFALWRALYELAGDPWHRRIACAFFLGMLAYDMFEVSLLQNNLSTGIALWITLALITQARFNPQVMAVSALKLPATIGREE